MDWTRKCGCRGGDGGCSYSGAWADHCNAYPNCENGIEEARIELANWEYNLPENKAKREKERLLRRAAALREEAEQLEKAATR